MSESTSNASLRWTRSEWRGALVELEGAGIPHILVTIVSAKGSTPRAAGTKMVVATEGVAGSIGGGTLERLAIETARRMLADGTTEPFLENQTLGIEQDQCCGGATSVLFEPIRPIPYHRLDSGELFLRQCIIEVREPPRLP